MPKCGASLDPGEKCDCVQTKEKSTETAATVNGANLNNHNQDITNSARVQEVIAALSTTVINTGNMGAAVLHTISLAVLIVKVQKAI